MPLHITLQGVQVGVGYGETPTGESVMGLQFVDPQSGIVITCNFEGEGLKQFLKQVKPVANLKIVGTMPQFPADGNKHGS